MHDTVSPEEVDALGIFLFGPHPRPELKVPDSIYVVPFFLPAKAPANYDVYLRSSGWKHTRNEALERAEGRCQICNANDRLEVHHRTYAHLGYEHPADLTVLCHWCHSHHHEGRQRG